MLQIMPVEQKEKTQKDRKNTHNTHNTALKFVLGNVQKECLRRNPPGNWVILILSGQKACTCRIIFKRSPEEKNSLKDYYSLDHT